MAQRRQAKAKGSGWVVRTLAELQEGPLPKRLILHMQQDEWDAMTKGIRRLKDGTRTDCGVGFQVVPLAGEGRGVLLVPSCQPAEAGGCCGDLPEGHEADC